MLNVSFKNDFRFYQIIPIGLFILSACATTAPETGEQDAPLEPTFVDGQSGLTSAPDLVQEFSLYRPSNLQSCNTDRPWAQGRQELIDWSSLQSGSCFALGYSLKEPAYAFLLHEGPDGALSRLRPDDCRVSDRQRLSAGVPVEFPDPGNIIELDNEPGAETFHLLAIPDRDVASRTLGALLALPSASANCERSKGLSN